MKLESVKRDILLQTVFGLEPYLAVPTVQNRQEKYNLPNNSLTDDTFGSVGRISPISYIKEHTALMASFED